MRRFASLLMSLSCLILVGCETPPRQGPRPAAGPARTAAPATPGAPIAAWRDRTVTFDDLRPALAELAGTTVLRDAFLDFRLEQALAERALTIDNAAVERERALLLRSLDASPDVAERLLQEIRAGQGLGPVRFAALLRRNAGLRALVQPDVRITQDALVRQFDVLYGPKRVSRIITVQTLREAVDIGQALDDGADFAELATRHSTDASAARGGLLAPLSKSDPAWPEPFRQALFRTGAGRNIGSDAHRRRLRHHPPDRRPSDNRDIDGVPARGRRSGAAFGAGTGADGRASAVVPERDPADVLRRHVRRSVAPRWAVTGGRGCAGERSALDSPQSADDDCRWNATLAKRYNQKLWMRT
ncbi:MAG: peptidylprolyl isomerase [Phycisphaerae bacterium]|nr:peptidylprolyl isomerase [Phycisphaerae bacterium]